MWASKTWRESESRSGSKGGRCPTSSRTTTAQKRAASSRTRILQASCLPSSSSTQWVAAKVSSTLLSKLPKLDMSSVDSSRYFLRPTYTYLLLSVFSLSSRWAAHGKYWHTVEFRASVNSDRDNLCQIDLSFSCLEPSNLLHSLGFFVI